MAHLLVFSAPGELNEFIREFGEAESLGLAYYDDDTERFNRAAWPAGTEMFPEDLRCAIYLVPKTIPDKVLARLIPRHAGLSIRSGRIWGSDDPRVLEPMELSGEDSKYSPVKGASIVRRFKKRVSEHALFGLRVRFVEDEPRGKLVPYAGFTDGAVRLHEAGVIWKENRFSGAVFDFAIKF